MSFNLIMRVKLESVLTLINSDDDTQYITTKPKYALPQNICIFNY